MPIGCNVSNIDRKLIEGVIVDLIRLVRDQCTSSSLVLSILRKIRLLSHCLSLSFSFSLSLSVSEAGVRIVPSIWFVSKGRKRGDQGKGGSGGSCVTKCDALKNRRWERVNLARDVRDVTWERVVFSSSGERPTRGFRPEDLRQRYETGLTNRRTVNTLTR